MLNEGIFFWGGEEIFADTQCSYITRGAQFDMFTLGSRRPCPDTALTKGFGKWTSYQLWKSIENVVFTQLEELKDSRRSFEGGLQQFSVEG